MGLRLLLLALLLLPLLALLLLLLLRLLLLAGSCRKLLEAGSRRQLLRAGSGGAEQRPHSQVQEMEAQQVHSITASACVLPAFALLCCPATLDACHRPWTDVAHAAMYSSVHCHVTPTLLR
jgi:hypothetical protein